MTDFEKMMKEMAQKAISNTEGVNTNNKGINEVSESEIAGAIAGLLGGLLSNAMVIVEGLDEDPMKQKEKKETPIKNSNAYTTKKEVNKGEKKVPLSQVLISSKKDLGTLGLDKLNKENLTELLVKEKLSVEDVANLFDVQKELVEYAIITHKVSVPKEKDLLEKRLIHVVGLKSLELINYFNTRIELIKSMKEPRLKEMLIKEFVIGLSELGYDLGMTINRNQLMLVKKDKELIYIHIYDLTVDELLNSYDLLKINWELK